MTKNEALMKVLADLKALSPDELRAELDIAKGSDFCKQMTALGEFIGSSEGQEIIKVYNI